MGDVRMRSSRTITFRISVCLSQLLFAIRVQHVMDVRKMNMKQAVRFLKKMDSQHRRYYNFYGGAQWGKPDNYDLCINSASYGINETENLILKLLNDQIH